MSSTLINTAYLVASVLFILGLKGLTHPRTAVRGNMLGALGMLIAVVVTLWDNQIITFEYILGGVLVAIGEAWSSRTFGLRLPWLVGGVLQIVLLAYAAPRLTTARIEESRAAAAA